MIFVQLQNKFYLLYILLTHKIIESNVMLKVIILKGFSNL